MNRNRVFLAVSVVIAATFGLWYGPRIHRNLEASSLPALLALAPVDSTVVVYADLASLRSSPLVQQLEAAAPSPKVDQDYTDFVSATGFDFQHDLDRVVLAVRPGPVTQTLVFAEGRFDRQKIGQYALRSGKIENHDGRAVYVIPSTTPGKNLYLTFLEGDRVALSDGGNLSAALVAVTPGAPRSFDPPLEQRLLRVSGAAIFAVAKAPDTSAGAAGLGAANPATPFQLLRWVSLAARPDGGEIVISAEGECDSPVQAQKVASALEFLRVLLRGGLSDPKARGQMSGERASSLDRLLKAATITNDAARVRLLLTITPDMIEAAPSASH